MNWNKRNIAIGILFIVFTLVCLSAILKGHYNSYYVVGTAIFAFFAVAFLKKELEDSSFLY